MFIEIREHWNFADFVSSHFWKWRPFECNFHHYQSIHHFKITLDINFLWNQRTLKFCRFCRWPFSKWPPFECNFHHYQSIPHFKITLENIEILPILSAAIRSRFFFVRIFHQPYLIYMPSLVEIPSAVSDISEVNDFDICSRFPWKRRPFWKFQDLNAPLEMEIHFPVKFSKDRIISLWEFGRTSSFGEEEEE